MTALRQKMIEDMQLRGFALRTQEAYLLAVRQLAHYYNKSPHLVTEEELRQYFLYLKNEACCTPPAPSPCAGSSSSSNIHLAR
jgi:hypothetical protein